ncbi:hypothetical protein [Dysgonomonas sp. 520]|uniref:hypothetical protein n=1 Tax=Dysgonomonas sp. 520 TaxID=2302931 RepID=UPI0013D3DB62|nr:hypothetical protein [Dysgonomonas sp. 520]NDW09122.1 hypothetical protein [Dysgonomonas sp. 520]
MKKSFFSLLAATLSFAAIMSSCLGDNESSISASEEYMLIKYDTEHTFMKYAVAPSIYSQGGFITFDGIESYGAGDIIKLSSYKVNMDNTVGGTNILKAQNVILPPSEVYPAASQRQLYFKNAEAVTDSAYTIFNGFSVKSFFGYPVFDDKWLISYGAAQKGGQYINMEVIFDKDNQKDGESALDKNTVVLDIRINKGEPAAGNEEVKEVTQSEIINLSSLRRFLPSSEYFKESESSSVTTVHVKFRTYVYNKTTKKVEISYPSYTYDMYFPKETEE